LSATGAIDERARRLAEEGREIFNFGVGQPDFSTPDPAVAAAIRAIGDGKTRYTSPRGTIELRRAVVEKLKRDNGLDYSPEEEVLVSCGGKHAIHNLLSAVLSPGEEVLLPTPTWVSYPAMIRLLGGVPRFVETRLEQGFRPNAGRLRESLTPRTVGLVINSPCNPSGAVLGREELLDLADVIEEAGLWVITDEIYERIIFDGHCHLSLPSVAPTLRSSVAVVNGVSKTFAMTGWRIGYAAAPAPWIETAASIQSHQTGNACSVSQEAAIAAIRSPGEATESMRRVFEKRRNQVVSILESTDGLEVFSPEGTFYAFPGVGAFLGIRPRGPNITTDTELATWLLDEAGVATVPGTAFAAPGHLRISFACDEESLTAGLDRLVQALDSLGPVS
jgi:aspartate aminotransferase